MKIRFFALSALAGLACAGFVLADVVKGPDLTATGTVVATGNASLVLKTDDHGSTIPFVIGTTTNLPPGLEPGSRVTVHYRPVGTDQQIADLIVLLEPAAPTALPVLLVHGVRPGFSWIAGVLTVPGGREDREQSEKQDSESGATPHPR